MRFLITGGSGFIGSNLVPHLLAQGHQISNIDALTYSRNPNSLANLEANPAWVFHKLDIAQGDASGIRHLRVNAMCQIRSILLNAAFNLLVSSSGTESVNNSSQGTPICRVYLGSRQPMDAKKS